MLKHISEADAQQIIDAVITPKSTPKIPMAKELASELNVLRQNHAHYWFMYEMKSEDKIKDQIADFEKYISKAVNVLEDDNGIVLAALQNQIHLLPPKVLDELEGSQLDYLKNLFEASGVLKELAINARKNWNNPLGHVTEELEDSEIIILDIVLPPLIEIYEQSFGKKMGKSKNKSADDGPGLRFLSTTLKTVGLKRGYSNSTLAKKLSDIRKSKKTSG